MFVQCIIVAFAALLLVATDAKPAAPSKSVAVIVELSSGPAVYTMKLVKFETFCSDNSAALTEINMLPACHDYIHSILHESYGDDGVDNYIFLLSENPFRVDVRLARCQLVGIESLELEAVAVYMYTTMSYEHRKFALDWMKERFSAPHAEAGEQVLEFITPEAVPRLRERFGAPRTRTGAVNMFGLGYNTYDDVLLNTVFSTPGFGEMEIRSCLGIQLVDSDYHPCVRRQISLPEDIQDEASLIQAITSVCQEEMSDTRSPDHNAFYGGYGSLLECVIMLQRSVVVSKLRNELGSDLALKHLFPKVEFPVLPRGISTRQMDSIEASLSATGVVNSKLLSGGRGYRAVPQQSGATCGDRLKTDRNWMDDLSSFEQQSLSQGSQDGILLGILQQLDSTNNYYVEIGFNNDHWVTGSNTYLLNKEYQWNGLLLDAEFGNPAINLHQHFVTADNVLGLFEKYGVPANPDYISVDIDSQDLWVARRILSSRKYRPRVMSIEYNCHLPLGSTATLPPGTGWNGFDAFYGASAGALKLMANEQGYEVVYFAGFLDMFLVHHSLLDGLCPPSFASFSTRVNHFHTCVTDPARKHKWVEYSTYMRMVSATVAEHHDSFSSLDEENDGDNEVTCRDEYTCTDENVLAVARRAALEQHMLMSKATDAYASGAACLGFAP